MFRSQKISPPVRRAVLETEALGASQPVSKKLGPNPALSFQRLVSKAQLLTVGSPLQGVREIVFELAFARFTSVLPNG